jgi:hypothetical protein
MAFRAVAFGESNNTVNVSVLGSDLTGLQVGDVMICGLAHRAGSVTVVPSDWTQFGPTQAMRTADGASITGRLLCYRKVAEAGDDSATFTWTMNLAQSHLAMVLAFSGRDQATPITDVQGFSNTASQATIDAPDVTAVSGDDIVSFAAITSAGTESFTSPPELTFRLDAKETQGGDVGVCGASADAVAAGVFSPGDFTTSLASGWQRMASITVAVAAAVTMYPIAWHSA